MKKLLQIWALGLACIGMTSCAGHRLDPAGEAQTKKEVTDAQVANLREPVQLEELQGIWGIGEGQPGPRVTYRSADHSGQFFWVYYSRPESAPNTQTWIVERIIRADRIEEGGEIVWPPRLINRSQVDAASDHRSAETSE